MITFTFEHDPDPQLEQLGVAIVNASEADAILFDVQHLHLPADTPADADYWPILDAYVIQHDYTPLGDGWIEIPRRMARKLLRHVLGESLAYPEPLMPPEEAEAYTEQFLDLFSAGSRYFTNGTCSGDTALYTITNSEVLGWHPLSTSTFDNGVIVVSPHRIGMIWVEDDD